MVLDANLHFVTNENTVRSWPRSATLLPYPFSPKPMLTFLISGLASLSTSLPTPLFCPCHLQHA